MAFWASQHWASTRGPCLLEHRIACFWWLWAALPGGAVRAVAEAGHCCLQVGFMMEPLQHCKGCRQPPLTVSPPATRPWAVPPPMPCSLPCPDDSAESRLKVRAAGSGGEVALVMGDPRIWTGAGAAGALLRTLSMTACTATAGTQASQQTLGQLGG